MFTLFGFLIVAPFLAPMISSMTPFSRKVFFGIGIGYNLFALASSNLGFDFSWGYLFSGFAFAFCVGAFVEDLFPTKKSRAWACLAGAGGLVVTVLLACNGWKNGIHDISPFYTLLAIGVYFAVLSLAENARPSRFVSFLANHSFTVYLVHMMFLPFVTNAIPHWLGAASLATYAICVAITFALSVLCAVVLDAVLIKPAQRGFDWIVARCSAGKAASSHPNGRANPSRRRGTAEPTPRGAGTGAKAALAALSRIGSPAPEIGPSIAPPAFELIRSLQHLLRATEPFRAAAKPLARTGRMVR